MVRWRAPGASVIVGGVRGTICTLLTAAAAVALTGCGQAVDAAAGGSTTPPADAPAPASATVEAELRTALATSETYAPDLTGLAVTYTVTNTGDTPLIVLTERGHAQSGSSTAPDEPGSVWVSGAGDGVARLSKQVFDAPQDVLLPAPWRAPGVLVDPGASVEGEMFAPLPLRTDLPPVGETMVHDEQELVVEPDLAEVCVQVAPSPGPDAHNDEITMGTPGKGLACTDALPLPTGQTPDDGQGDDDGRR